MKTFLFFAALFALFRVTSAQSIKGKLQAAYRQFEQDAQLRHALSSLYVVNANTGQVVFAKNSQIGLAPASTQKVITAVTAFELLGKDYKYKTDFGYEGELSAGSLKGSICIIGSGDPTFGSWRFQSTMKESIDTAFVTALREEKINTIKGGVVGVTKNFETQKIPDGWIWEDIANYYGAGSGSLNWNENQFDLVLKPGKHIRDSVQIIGTNPKLSNEFLNELRTGPANSGDNGYIYFCPSCPRYEVRGVEPCCVDTVIISGATADHDMYTLNHFADLLMRQRFADSNLLTHIKVEPYYSGKPQIFYSHVSPPLDSIVYWFLQKSINLYGEALMKTFAFEKRGFGATDSGIVITKDFWKQKGIDPAEINIKDGSGLSPQNRVTTHAQAEVLKYARQQSWFPYFLAALSEFNHIKMKSGSIGDVKGFCGYQKSGDGNEYIFSFLVNNYDGASSTLVNKMYKVLDVLK